jgi:hypothetical protein
VHALLDQGVGLLECARRLGWTLNTVKRYTRAATAEDLQRPPRYREPRGDIDVAELWKDRTSVTVGGCKEDLDLLSQVGSTQGQVPHLRNHNRLSKRYRLRRHLRDVLTGATCA